MSWRGSIRLVALTLVVTACGGSGGEATPTTVATTTTTLATTTTTQRIFTADELGPAVLATSDPWVVPILASPQLSLTLDSIWPAAQFPAQRTIYEEAGFTAALFAMFTEPGATVITAAHLFADPQGAARAADLIKESFSNTELVAAITGLSPGSLDDVADLEVPALGDRAMGVLISGDTQQVVGIVWTTGNLLQFIRVGMLLGDAERTSAAIAVAEAMAARMG